MAQSPCIFCQIVAGEVPSHKVWESETHLAFLTIFPNTKGVTVVIPKHHVESYIFGVDAAEMHDLMDASSEVAQKIDRAFKDVGRTGVVFEGFGVNHLHAKLYPLHGTAETSLDWRQIESARPEVFFERYPGYISSRDSNRADDAVLATIAERIRLA